LVNVKHRKGASRHRIPKVPRWQLVANLYKWHIKCQFPNTSKSTSDTSWTKDQHSLAIQLIMDRKQDPRGFQLMSTQETITNFIEHAQLQTANILGKVKQTNTTKPDHPIDNAANSHGTYYLLQITQHFQASTCLAVIAASPYL